MLTTVTSFTPEPSTDYHQYGYSGFPRSTFKTCVSSSSNIEHCVYDLQWGFMILFHSPTTSSVPTNRKKHIHTLTYLIHEFMIWTTCVFLNVNNKLLLWLLFNFLINAIYLSHLYLCTRVKEKALGLQSFYHTPRPPLNPPLSPMVVVSFVIVMYWTLTVQIICCACKTNTAHTLTSAVYRAWSRARTRPRTLIFSFTRS